MAVIFLGSYLSVSLFLFAKLLHTNVRWRYRQRTCRLAAPEVVLVGGPWLGCSSVMLRAAWGLYVVVPGGQETDLSCE